MTITAVREPIPFTPISLVFDNKEEIEFYLEMLQQQLKMYTPHSRKYEITHDIICNLQRGLIRN